jgi:hypothetical protein
MSTQRNDGGPAFPIGSTPEEWGNGATLRDYFIAHAPAEPQPWFDPVLPKDYSAEKYIKQRYIQWPAAWADAMIAERNKA